MKQGFSPPGIAGAASPLDSCAQGDLFEYQANSLGSRVMPDEAECAI